MYASGPLLFPPGLGPDDEDEVISSFPSKVGRAQKNAERTLRNAGATLPPQWQFSHLALGGGPPVCSMPPQVVYSMPPQVVHRGAEQSAPSAGRAPRPEQSGPRVEELRAERCRHAEELIALFRRHGQEITVSEFQRLQARDAFVELLRKYRIEDGDDSVQDVDDSVEPWAWKFFRGGGLAGGAAGVEAPGRVRGQEISRGQDHGGEAYDRSFFDQVMAAGMGTDMYTGDGRLRIQPLRACCAMAMVHRRSYPKKDGHESPAKRLCEPCEYFHKKDDRCDRGVHCAFCHVCSKAERNRFKKAKQKEKWKAKDQPEQTQ